MSPTHATENRLEMHAAVEHALHEVLHTPAKDAPYPWRRQRFLDVLADHGHVVGHVTDRHHELQARCAQLLAVFDEYTPRFCPGCLACINPDPSWAVTVEATPHADGCPLEAIRAIVNQPSTSGAPIPVPVPDVGPAGLHPRADRRPSEGQDR